MLQKKILLVDDSSTMILMERMALAGGGYQLLAARDGEEAVATARLHHPDLILLDIVMPKMDGFEVCRRLRAEGTTRETPIILVTTKGEEDHMQRGFESGCNDYVLKPLNGVELLTKVRNLLGD
ncbi:MAG TPA: response regulator [Thermoanaerobaculia bacterium]|nr:response regulator [Thermoanaerobaculia bacterium]